MQISPSDKCCVPIVTRQFGYKFMTSDSLIDFSKLRSAKDTEFSSETPFQMTQLLKIIGVARGTDTMRVLDMTAHIGGFSLPWATKFPRDKITSVEFDKSVFKTLQYNIKSLGLKNIVAIHQRTS